MIRKLASVAPVALLCSAAPIAAATPSRAVRLGQTVYVDGPRVRPLKVIEDSRCPMNARCVWAGRIVVRTRVTGGRWSRTLDLILGEAEQVGDGKLTLVGVSPDRVAGKQLSPDRLRFTFTFSGGL